MALEFRLTPEEARVLGVLIEKEATTPDQYPLSLAAVTTGCNQRSNRDPVMDLREDTVHDALEGLASRALAREKTPHGSRVVKYVHRLSNTLGLSHEFTGEGLAVICVLLLRGAQTAGEIRTRAARLHRFGSVAGAEETLERLMADERGPYVGRLPRGPGQKEPRFAHLFCGEVEAADDDPGPPPEAADGPGRISALEEEVAALREELEEVKKLLLE